MKNKAAAAASLILLVCAYSTARAGWDPGTPIQGHAYAALPGDPGQQDKISVFVNDTVEFWAEAQDVDVEDDPPGEDGVHCDWSCSPCTPSDMGKTKANDLCTHQDYQETKVTRSWDTVGTYIVTCVMNDCALWADDAESLEDTITVNVVDSDKCVLYTYDGNGNRIRMRDSRGTTEYDYDWLDRLTKVTEPDDTYIAYEYDWNNRRTKMTDHFSGVTTYDYTDRGLLWHLTDRNNGVTTYTYWPIGVLKKVEYPNGTYAEYGDDEEYGYTERGWLKTLEYKKADETIIAAFTYEYNPAYWGKNGTRTKMTENILKPDSSRIQATVDYEYDDLYQLTREQRTGTLPYDKNYTYDKVGNRLTMVVGETTTYYHHDSANKLNDYGPSDTLPYTGNTFLDYDDAGNMTAKGSTSYTWNWMGKLASVDEGETNIATYAYNGDAVRVEKTVGTTTTEFLYDSGEVVAEVVGTNVTHYVGPGMDIISRIEGTTRKVFHADGLGSTHAMTDASSAVTGAADYDAWGNILVAAGDTTSFGYAGRFRYYADPETEFYLLKARYYDPAVGRFVSRDPIGYEAGLNLYPYAANRPSVLVDPTGELPFIICAIGIGIGAGIFIDWAHSCYYCGVFTDLAWDYAELCRKMFPCDFPARWRCMEESPARRYQTYYCARCGIGSYTGPGGPGRM